MARRRTAPLRVEALEARDAPTVVPVGGEFRVNTYTTGDQYYPRVAMDVAGDFVIAWHSSNNGVGGVDVQRYSAAGVAQGPELRVSTNSNFPYPAVAMDAAGGFVVAWGQDGPDARRFNSAGVAQGDQFRVS